MPNITLQELSDIAFSQAKEKGFGTTPEEINVGEKIAAIHSEVSEAYEAYRHQNIKGQGGLEENMADAVIRILHLARVLSIDIESAMVEKLQYNKGREWEWERMNETHT